MKYFMRDLLVFGNRISFKKKQGVMLVMPLVSLVDYRLILVICLLSFGPSKRQIHYLWLLQSPRYWPSLLKCMVASLEED